MTEKLTRKLSTIGSQVTSIVSVALVLVLLGVLMLTAIITSDTSSDMRRQMGVIVKLYPGVSTEEIDDLQKTLSAIPAVKSLEFTSAEAVLAEEKSYNQELLGLVGLNPFSAEIELVLEPAYVNSDSIQRLSQNLELMAQVEEVYSELDVVDSVNQFISRIKLYLVIVAVVLTLIAVMLIYNMVGLSVYSRRFVIDTMKLVGATDKRIREPFMRSAISIGLISAASACVLLLLLRAFSSTFESDMLFVVSASQYIMIFIVISLIGIGLCAGSVYLATNRYISTEYDELFK